MKNVLRPRKFLSILIGAALIGGLLASCGQQPVSELSVVSAVATSKTSVVVTFSEAVGQGADQAVNYMISAPDGSKLEVMAAYPDASGVSVALATEPQEQVTYVLSVANIKSAKGGRAAAQLEPAGQFGGSGEGAPIVASAIALSNTEVLVTFADPNNGQAATMGPGAENAAYYEIDAPDLGVQEATLSADGTTVLLTTSSQENREYTVKVTNVFETTGKMLLDPFNNRATFGGIPEDDEIAPEILGVVATNNTTVLVSFGEPVTDAAADPTLYTITDPGGQPLAVIDAVLNEFNTQVTLTTAAQAEGVAYTLAIAGIKDRAGNEIDPSTETTFTGVSKLGPPNADITPPRISNAGSSSNTTVIVTFSEPVQGGEDSAENEAHYRISADLLGNGEVTTQATLNVTGAELNDDRTSVTLTTGSQSDLRYTLEVANVKDLAGNQIAPPDLGAPNPSATTFMGTPPGGESLIDSDGDGLSNDEELRGWIVNVKLLDGSVVRREVTSDPNVADTDGDGIGDFDEKNYGADPRNADTDDDGLTDYEELNEIYSDPAHQDTDGDGLTDGLEVTFFGTSALFADTDGDSLDDDYEIATGNRNPRIADLPQPQIKIGSIDLALDVRFETQTQQGESAVEAKSREVTLQQDESQTNSTTDSSTNEWFFKAGATLGFEVSVGFKDPGTKYSGQFSTEGGASGSSTFQVSNETARSSSQTYADTLSTENTFSREESLSRRIDAAEIGVLVEIENLSNIAFTMTDLEITALVKDRRDPRILIPIATLVQQNPDAEISLGALDTTARGPFRFVATDAFPARVEDLMSNPRGVVFKVANYNIRDEEGRNFVFGEQDANDRTAPLVIDFGVQVEADGQRTRGAVERYRVATNSDFDENGKPNGITVAEALEEIIGLTHYDEEDDPTEGLTDEELRNSYSTFDLDGVRLIWRIRDVGPSITLEALEGGEESAQGWVVLLETGIDYGVDVRSFVLQPENGLTLAFVQDLDEDRVPARVEFYYGSDDTEDDSDSDSLSDYFEIYTGWNVEVNRGLGNDIELDVYEVRSSPARTDTDGDGLTDWEELNGCLDRNPANEVCDPGTGFGISVDEDGNVTRATKPTDPTNPDTDGDRVLDGDEVFGYTVEPTLTAAKFVKTDPTDVDTDNDGVADGDEVVFGGNPALFDVASFTDSDGDGLLDQEELDGWTVRYEEVSANSGVAGDTVTCTATSYAACGVPPTSDPTFGNIDTDGDGLTDAEEYELGTHPRLVDTDGDGISDYDEVQGELELPFDNQPRQTDPTDADSDDDKLSDGAEIVTGWDVTLAGVTKTVFSDPTDADLDGDGLEDFDEKNATTASGTDPNDPDTDGDGSTDKVEVDRSDDDNDNNDTDPLIPDQVVQLKVELRGVQSGGLNSICGQVTEGGNVYVYGNLGFEIDGSTDAPYYTSGGYTIGTSYVQAYSRETVFAGSSQGIKPYGRNLIRWDGVTEFTLNDVPNDTFKPTATNNLFNAQTTKDFIQKQNNSGLNPDDCQIQFLYTVTPLSD